MSTHVDEGAGAGRLLGIGAETGIEIVIGEIAIETGTGTEMIVGEEIMRGTEVAAEIEAEIAEETRDGIQGETNLGSKRLVLGHFHDQHFLDHMDTLSIIIFKKAFHASLSPNLHNEIMRYCKAVPFPPSTCDI